MDKIKEVIEMLEELKESCQDIGIVAKVNCLMLSNVRKDSFDFVIENAINLLKGQKDKELLLLTAVIGMCFEKHSKPLQLTTEELREMVKREMERQEKEKTMADQVGRCCCE